MKKEKLYSKSRAFTLVEILTVVFLGTVLIMVGYTVYEMSYKSYTKNSNSSELTQNARIALERMSREIRQAQEVITPLPDNAGSSCPPLEIKFQDGHDTTPIQYIKYYRSSSDNDLYRQTSHYYTTNPDVWVKYETGAIEVADLPVAKAQKISALQFWGTNSTVTINLTVSNNNTNYTFETKTLGRNIQGQSFVIPC